MKEIYVEIFNHQNIAIGVEKRDIKEFSKLARGKFTKEFFEKNEAWGASYNSAGRQFGVETNT